MNTPVSFLLAKLLKEKEFKDKNMLGTVRLSQPKYYDPNGLIHDIKDAFEKKNYKLEDCFNAPTIAEVVMWLYEKHGIWINASWKETDESFQYSCHLINSDILPRIFCQDGFNSPTEAYEAAIEYTLNKLI